MMAPIVTMLAKTFESSSYMYYVSYTTCYMFKTQLQ